MSLRDTRPAASTLELSLTNDDLTFEANEGATATGPEPRAISIDYTAFVGRIEDVTRKRWVGSDCFESIDCLGQIEFVGFEMRQQFNAEFDRILSAPRRNLTVLVRLTHSEWFRRRPHNRCRKTTRRMPVPET